MFERKSQKLVQEPNDENILYSKNSKSETYKTLGKKLKHARDHDTNKLFLIFFNYKES